MLITLVPMFDENLTVSAYSLFTQKKNHLLNPSLQGTGQNDGEARIAGLELLESVGINTLCDEKEIFVAVSNISVFSDIQNQCTAPHNRIILLIDSKILPQEMYINRLKELKALGYKLAIRRLEVQNFEEYKEVLLLMDYILLNHKKINIEKAKIYFSNLYPRIKLCAVNIETKEIYDQLKSDGGYQFYEGEFFRMPITHGDNEVSPLKINYIDLLNIVNDDNFDLGRAASVIGRDTALVISLLKIVNTMARNSEITSIQHAAAMLGQKELKKWINAAVTRELCADRPNEIMRLSLLRAKFAEHLAAVFEISVKSDELFLMGLFSVLDLILDKTMAEALETVKVSKGIRDALISNKGDLAIVLEFVIQYESANWQEVSRLMILKNITVDQVCEAYVQSLQWYRDLFI